MAFTVIGAAGFVGAHLARHIRSRGSTCHGVTLDDATGLFGREHDHIIFCADDAGSPAMTIQSDVGMLAPLLQHVRFETLTYLSSTGLCDTDDGTVRLNPAASQNLTLLTKALGENLCLNSGRAEVRVVRLASVYADNLMADTFLHRVLRAARDGTDISFDVAPDAEHDFVHVDDVCSVLVHVARHGRRPTYNLASGVNVSNANLFDMVARLTGMQLTAGLPPCGTRAPLIDIGAIREDFSIRPVPLQGRLASVLKVPALGTA